MNIEKQKREVIRMKIEELANKIIRYGKCIYDKENRHNTRIQHFFYDNKDYKIVKRNEEFLTVRIIKDYMKEQKQLKLIQDYLIQEVAPKFLNEIWQLENDSDIYDFAELIDYVIRNKVAEDKTYKLMDKLQGVIK